MTISPQTVKKQADGNGVTTAFPTDFKFLAAGDLRVLLTDVNTGIDTLQVLTTNYTVTGEGNDLGGTVTFLVAPTGDDRVTILLNMPYEQESDYTPLSKFPAEVLETDLDRLTLMIQQLAERVSRCIQVGETSTVVNAKIPTLLPFKYLGTDSDGDLVLVDGIQSSVFDDDVFFYGDVYLGNPGEGKSLYMQTSNLEMDGGAIIGALSTTRNSSNFAKTNNTLANVTGLSADLPAGLYEFTAKLFVDAQATGGHKYAIAGSGITGTVVYQIQAQNNADGTFQTSRQTALGGSAGWAGPTALYTVITGTINITVGGTLSVQFAQNVTNASPSTVLANSSFTVRPF